MLLNVKLSRSSQRRHLKIGTAATMVQHRSRSENITTKLDGHVNNRAVDIISKGSRHIIRNVTEKVLEHAEVVEDTTTMIGSVRPHRLLELVMATRASRRAGNNTAKRRHWRRVERRWKRKWNAIRNKYCTQSRQ